MAGKHGLQFLSGWSLEAKQYKLEPRDSYQEFIDKHPHLKNS